QDAVRLEANARYLSELSALQSAQIDRYRNHPLLWVARMTRKSVKGTWFLLTNWGEFRHRWRVWRGGGGRRTPGRSPPPPPRAPRIGLPRRCPKPTARRS